MGYKQNGTWVPTVASGPPARATDDSFLTREEQIDFFLKNELNEFCRRRQLTDGCLINVAVGLYGVNVTVNGKGNAKRRVKTTEGAATRLERVYTSSNYLICRDKDSNQFEAMKILGNEEWLEVKKVTKAFAKICQAQAAVVTGMGDVRANWRPETLSKVQLSEIEMPDAFHSVAFTSTVEDVRGQVHLLACLVTNGLLMYDVEAEVRPWDLSKRLLRVSDCVFRFEIGMSGLAGLNRI